MKASPSRREKASEDKHKGAERGRMEGRTSKDRVSMFTQGSKENRALEIRIRALMWETMGTVTTSWSSIILLEEAMETITTSWSSKDTIGVCEATTWET